MLGKFKAFWVVQSAVYTDQHYCTCQVQRSGRKPRRYQISNASLQRLMKLTQYPSIEVRDGQIEITGNIYDPAGPDAPTTPAPAIYAEPVCAECGQPLTAEDIEAGETVCLECAGVELALEINADNPLLAEVSARLK